MIIILSAPSGCGKSSIADRLLSLDPKLALSVSATTRPPRPKEIDGIDYFFKTKEEFAKTDLLEHAEIYGNMYGTPRHYVETQLQNNKDILFDIDSQGAYQIMEKVKSKVIAIYILPPNLQTLRTRLLKRNQNTPEDIEFRLSKAMQEQEHAKNYDYTVINDDFDRAVAEIQSIINFERNKAD